MVTKYTQKAINASGKLDIPTLQEKLKAVRQKRYGRPPEFKTKKSFAPSNLGFIGQCPRHWYYAFNGANYEEKFSEQSAAALENGKATHERLQGEYLEALYGTHIEVKVVHDYPPIFGFADVIFEVNEDGTKTLVDIKSIKDEKFKVLEIKLRPDPGNALQVLIYMYIKKIPSGLLHYENKNTHEELFFPLTMTERNKAYVERALSWMSMVHENAVNGELPTRPYEKTSWHCKFCPLAKKCWREDKDLDGEVTIPPFELEEQ